MSVAHFSLSTGHNVIDGIILFGDNIFKFMRNPCVPVVIGKPQ